MKMMKVIVRKADPVEGEKEVLMFTTSKGRQVIGTYNRPNLMEESIVAEMIAVAFDVEILDSWEE